MLGRRIAAIIIAIGLVSPTSRLGAAELQQETLDAWERYVALTEKRIEKELDTGSGFLVQDFLSPATATVAKRTLGEGDVFITKLETQDEDGLPLDVPKGMIHHWLGSVFIPGARVEELLVWLQNYEQHQRYFEEVEDSRILTRRGDAFQVFLRLKRTKVVTVHYNTEHRTVYRRHPGKRASSVSTATRIAEVGRPGTPEEYEKPAGEDRGFLWRLNSYWRFAEVDGGVIVECESVSLSRGIPRPLRWLVGGYVDSVPRESLEATLRPIQRQAPRALATSVTTRPDKD